MSKEKALELVLDGGEVALKQVVDNSLLKDIPVVGSIVKAYEIGASIRDRLYVEKLKKFLRCLNEIPAQKKEEMKGAIVSGERPMSTVSEKILLVIESQTDMEKSEMVANFFLAYLDGLLSESELRKAIDVTASAFLDDLKEFLKGNGMSGFMRSTYENLERSNISGLINTPLIGIDPVTMRELREDGWLEAPGSVLFQSTYFGSKFQSAYAHGKRLRALATDYTQPPQFHSDTR